MLDEIAVELQNAGPRKPEQAPITIPVRIQDDRSSSLGLLGVLAGPLFRTLGAISLTIALTVSMLMLREELRNRLFLLLGHGHLTQTTKAIDDVSKRISGYLFTQVILNTGFGIFFGTGLWLIGVPYAWSLGVVAGILEVVPYVGGAITVILAGLSATTVGVPQLVAVIVLYVILVNIESHILAPLLYGRAVGLPPVAILLALLAGVELIGVLGALLAVPMTVIFWAIFEEFAPIDDADTG